MAWFMARAARWQAVCAAESASAASGVDREVYLRPDLGSEADGASRCATCQVQPGSPRFTGISAPTSRAPSGPLAAITVSTTGWSSHRPVSPGWSGQVWSTG